MKLSPFLLEHYLEKYEFTAPYLMCTSDSETFRVDELLAMSDPEARALWQDLRLGYTEVQGAPLLREAISQLYDHAKGSDIFCFAGAEEGIFCALNALCKKGDHAIVVRPIYQSLETIPQGIGVETTAVSLKEEEEWALNPDDIEAALRPSTRVILLNFPNNPTGAVLTPEVRDRIVAVARRRGIHIFSDEVYQSPDDSGTRPVALADVYERAMSLNVLSKSFGLPGLRVGWIYTRDAELLSSIRNLKHYLSICNAGPSEVLALMALRSRDTLWKRNRAIFQSNVALWSEFVGRFDRVFSWVPPRGGVVAFPRLLSEPSVDAFAEKLVQQEGVLILPGSVFHWDQNNFRIGLGRKNFPEALARFERFVVSFVGR